MNTAENGHIMANSCRVLLVDFVDTTVYAFAYLEVEVLTCVAFLLFTNYTGLTMLLCMTYIIC